MERTKYRFLCGLSGRSYPLERNSVPCRKGCRGSQQQSCPEVPGRLWRILRKTGESVHRVLCVRSICAKIASMNGSRRPPPPYKFFGAGFFGGKIIKKKKNTRLGTARFRGVLGGGRQMRWMQEYCEVKALHFSWQNLPGALSWK